MKGYTSRPMSLNNLSDDKFLKRLGMIREFKTYQETKLLKEAYTIINNHHHESKNERL